MDKKALNIFLPSKLYDGLKAEANRIGISLAALVRIIATEYLNKEKNNGG